MSTASILHPLVHRRHRRKLIRHADALLQGLDDLLSRSLEAISKAPLSGPDLERELAGDPRDDS